MRIARHREGLGNPGIHHREHVTSTLEVVVREDGPADDWQVGVGANKVVREALDEVEEPCHVGTVHMHEPMLAAHDDAVLVEVGIGAVLHAPALATQGHGYDAQVLPRRMRTEGGVRATAGIAFVLHAERACRVLPQRSRSPCRHLACCASARNVARVLLRLGEVDGKLQVSPASGRDPLHVAGNGLAPHVVHVTAEPIEPIRSRNDATRLLSGMELVRHVRGASHEGAHEVHGHMVTVHGTVGNEPVGDGNARKPVEQRVNGEVRRGHVHRRNDCAGLVAQRGGASLTHKLQNAVVGPVLVLSLHDFARHGVRDQR